MLLWFKAVVCTVQSNPCFVLHLNGFCHLPNNDKHWTLDISYMLYIKDILCKTFIYSNWKNCHTDQCRFKGGCCSYKRKWISPFEQTKVMMERLVLGHPPSSVFYFFIPPLVADNAVLVWLVAKCFWTTCFSPPLCRKGKMFCFYSLLWNI